jgi:hypothetical protein
VAEKGPRGRKSVEVLTRAALENSDANRPAPVDALIPGRPSGPVSPKTLAGRPFTDAARAPRGKMGRMPAASAAQRKSRRERGLLMAASMPFVVGDFRILISAIAMKGALNPLIRA